MTWKKTSEKWVIPRNMLLQVLIPTLISSAALSLSNIADAVTVGQRLGEKALAAIGIVTPIYLFYNVIALSFGIGGSIVHAQLCARRKELLTPALFRKIAFWTGGISLFLILAGNLFPDFLLRLLAASEEDPELWTMCRQYARPLLTASPILLFSYMLYYFVQNDDDPRRAAQAMTAGGILDVVLNILFVLVAGWGVRGGPGDHHGPGGQPGYSDRSFLQRKRHPPFPRHFRRERRPPAGDKKVFPDFLPDGVCLIHRLCVPVLLPAADEPSADVGGSQGADSRNAVCGCI